MAEHTRVRAQTLMISPRQMRHFLAVARTGSFSAASAEVRIAQSALSTQIAQIEDRLGVQLLLRHSRGVELTAAGRLFADRIEGVLTSIDQLVCDVRTLQADQSGNVRIGLPTTTTSSLALPLLHAFQHLLPRVNVSLVEGMTGHLLSWFEHGDLELAVLFDSDDLIQYNRRYLGRERVCLIGPRSPALGDRSRVTVGECLRLPIVHCTRAHRLRRMIEDKAHTLNIPLHVVAEIDSLTQMKNLVFNGAGYTILPQAAVTPDWVHGKIGAWTIDESDLAIDLVLVVAPKFLYEPIYRSVIDLLFVVVSDLINTGAWAGASLAAGSEMLASSSRARAI
jgi:LysR family transcriptional regulator, nitrogen assimilation regulatory protein